MANIHVLVGIQGSGKSVLANAIREKQGGVILEPDAFRWVLTGQAYHKHAEDTVWSHVKVAARVFLRQSEDIIIDATNTNRSFRSMWIHMRKEEGSATTITAHVVLTPLDVALDRNSKRIVPVPAEHVQKYASRFEMPTLEEGFYYIYIYNQRLEVVGWAGSGSKPPHNTKTYDDLVWAGKPYSHPLMIENLQGPGEEVFE